MSVPAEDATGQATSIRRRLRSSVDRHGAWIVAAVIVALALRVAWAVVASGTPPNRFNDAAEYVRVAKELASGSTPSIGGRPTAFFKLGYPLVLVPVVWLSRLTGDRLSVELGAALLNAVIGAGTVALGATLAGQWFSRAARAPAAWLLALCPPAILITSTALADTLVTFLGALTIAVAFRVRSRHADPSVDTTLRVLGLGLLLGFGALVRGTGLVLVPVVLAMLWRRRLRETARTAAVLALGVVLVLTPGAIRNRIEVGVAAPLATGAASSSCLAHRDGADGFPDFSRKALRECYAGSPYDDASLYRPGDEHVYLGPQPGEPPNEAEWYQRTQRRAFEWATGHPLEELQMAVDKSVEVMTTTAGSISAATDGGSPVEWSPDGLRLLGWTGDVWLWAVTSLSALALLVLPAARRAFPLWATPALLLGSIWGGIVLDRYQHPLFPFMVALAGGALAAARGAGRLSSPGRRPAPGGPDARGPAPRPSSPAA